MADAFAQKRRHVPTGDSKVVVREYLSMWDWCEHHHERLWRRYTYRRGCKAKGETYCESCKKGSTMSTPLYCDFILMLQPISKNPKAVWYHSDTPIEWSEARDRIVNSGATKGFTAGGYGEGQFMLSVDSTDIDLWKRSGRPAVAL